MKHSMLQMYIDNLTNKDCSDSVKEILDLLLTQIGNLDEEIQELRDELKGERI